MKKDYLKPEVEMISLITEEKITTSDGEDLADGELGLESSIF